MHARFPLTANRVNIRPDFLLSLIQRLTNAILVSFKSVRHNCYIGLSFQYQLAFISVFDLDILQIL
jgi:hypothetical protein